MGDVFSRFNFGELMGFLSVSGGLLVAVIAIVGGLWADVRKAELASALKHDMLDRGLSADEIRTVLDAGTKRAARCSRESHAMSA
ncbi:MAG TPA: hypothetical protein VFG04_11630 [Planctomycetaceae bacterium]|jgi:hypothetical protein|nr:hypothetical protein [Planctomycetaceae bacterium]